MADLESAVGSAHAAGLVHGSLRAEDVVVIGDRAFLSALHLPTGPPDVALAQDRAALAALGEQLERARPRPPHATRAGVVITLVLLAAAGFTLLRSRDAPDVPATRPGTTVIGSVAGEEATSVVCQAGCTLVGTDPRGGPLRARVDGVVRGWTVRGARGGLALQVVRRVGDGTFAEVGRSQYVEVRSAAPTRFAGEVPVRRGDLLGVELLPGAALGRVSAGAVPLRWVGPLELGRPPRAPQSDSLPAGRLHVRYELVPGARPRGPAQAGGRAARTAATGVVLDREVVEAGRTVAEITVVRVRGGIAVDLVRGGRRRWRVAVPEADPAGQVDILEQGFTTQASVRLQWLNPDGAIIRHSYAVRPGRLVVQY